jgi:lysophospholipase L1-like esterase
VTATILSPARFLTTVGFEPARPRQAVALNRARLLATLILLLPALPALAAPSTPPPDGFVALFNGRDLSGWKGLVKDPPARARMTPQQLAAEQSAADQRMRAHWTVTDGVLTFDGHGENLCTAADYADFELVVDWKIELGGDSGIYLRGSPQVQIWDNPLGSGGLYNNQHHTSRPLIVADNPPGQWNTFRIFMLGQRVTVYLNGLLVVDRVPLENYWERDRPIYTRGAIELQSHSTPLSFRNIFIRELPTRRETDAAGPLLKPGDRVAIAGDSITEQRLYSRFVEDYLLACVPQLDLSVMQFGWSGETAPGFVARLKNDVLPWRPDVLTTCYGMNDGGYRPYEPATGQAYYDAMCDLVRSAGTAGMRVLVGAPPPVDTRTFGRALATAAVYNENLAHLRDLARRVAIENGLRFADVYDHVALAMRKAKATLGEDHHVCGADGIHPAANGHLVIAYALLKSLGLQGDIGTITVDLKGQPEGWTASASDGHRVLAVANSTVEIESTRYPFCFYGQPGEPEATRSMIPFVPFNADLNRLILIVQNLDAPAATVTWGANHQRFTREQLAAGINLAAEFPDNPFSAAFAAVDEAVARKQAFETRMIKDDFRKLMQSGSPGAATTSSPADLKAARSALLEQQLKFSAQARAAVVPVRHTIGIRPDGT